MKKSFSILLCLLSVFLISSCGNTTSSIDLQKYVTVTFTGKNGEGIANKDVDVSQFEKDIAPLEGMNLDVDTMTMTEMSKWFGIESAIDYTLSPTTGLSNGDKVLLTCTVDESGLKNLGVKTPLKGFTKEYTVEGLQ